MTLFFKENYKCFLRVYRLSLRLLRGWPYAGSSNPRQQETGWDPPPYIWSFSHSPVCTRPNPLIFQPWCVSVVSCVCVRVTNRVHKPFADISEGVPDERAVMTYVSSYYHTFTGVQKVSLRSWWWLEKCVCGKGREGSKEVYLYMSEMSLRNCIRVCVSVRNQVMRYDCV